VRSKGAPAKLNDSGNLGFLPLARMRAPLRDKSAAYSRPSFRITQPIQKGPSLANVAPSMSGAHARATPNLRSASERRETLPVDCFAAVWVLAIDGRRVHTRSKCVA
jgi:hypothetical protein